MQHHLLTFPHLPLLQHYRHMEHIPFHFYVYTTEIPLCNIPHIFKPYPMLRNDSRQDTLFRCRREWTAFAYRDSTGQMQNRKIFSSRTPSAVKSPSLLWSVRTARTASSGGRKTA